jgi:hypothetical protein
VLGKRKLEDAMRDINALKHSQPYSDRVQTPNEEMTGRPSQVAGIPSPDYILNGEIPAHRITKGEYKGTNPTYKSAPQPTAPEQPQTETAPTDTDPDTAEENEMSKDWLEKTSESNPTAHLECGDRIYYIDYHYKKGPRKWRRGIIIQRKQEYAYANRARRTAHGYDIYDIENCTHVTRTRNDIRKYRPTKMEREAMEQINRNLALIREEYEKNKECIGKGFRLPSSMNSGGSLNPFPMNSLFFSYSSLIRARFLLICSIASRSILVGLYFLMSFLVRVTWVQFSMS